MGAEAWAALAAVAAILATVIAGTWRVSWLVGSALSRFEVIGSQQASEIGTMKNAIEKIEVTIASIAVDRERATALERRVTRLENYYDEVRRGIGLIRPPADVASAT